MLRRGFLEEGTAATPRMSEGWRTKIHILQRSFR